MTENQALESCDSGLCVAADGILIAIKMRSPEPSSAVAIWVLSFISRLWRRCRGPLLRLIISRLTVQAWTSAGWRASEGTLYHRQQRSSKIGRASCRERVCQYVELAGGAGSLKKK